MHTLAFLLLCFTDRSPPADDPLPDVPPGLPAWEECHRISWQLWARKCLWEEAADRLPAGDRDRANVVTGYWFDASWSWWDAGRLQNRDLSDASRRGARRQLVGRIGELDYRHGWMPPSEP